MLVGARQEVGRGRAPLRAPVNRLLTLLDPGDGRLPLGPPRDWLRRVLHGAAHPPCHLRRLLEVGGTPGRVQREVASRPRLGGAASSSFPAHRALSGS